MSARLAHMLRSTRAGPLLAALLCLAVVPARAIDLEGDLSSHHIEIRTNFAGTEITVFGSVTGDNMIEAQEDLAGADVIVVVRGPAQRVFVRRKEELGPIWANRTSFLADNVPSFYYIASTKPLASIVDEEALQRYQIGFGNLDVGFAKAVRQAETTQAAQPPSPANDASFDDMLVLGEGEGAQGAMPAPVPMAAPAAPGVEESTAFRDALIRLLQQRRTFLADGQLSVIRAHLFRTEVAIPATVPAGSYGAELYLVKDKAILDAEYIAFFIDKKGLERDINTLATKHPIVHGFLAVLIAVAAGWLGELAIGRRR